MTEADAKQRWCPFARVWHCDGEHGDVTGVAINRFASEHDPIRDTNARCIGSMCMAWRTTHVEIQEERFAQEARPEGEGWEPFSDSPRNCAWKRTLAAPVTHGFCGLAGGSA